MKHIKLFENFDKNEIDDICKKYGIENYTINSDGSIDVDGQVDLRHQNLVKLPLKFNKISNYFDCSENDLTTLEGCPRYVDGTFDCSNNKLTSLKYSPEYVGVFDCSYNYKLLSLKDFETNVEYNFGGNYKLTSIYDIMRNNLEDINNFYEFGIITNLESDKPILNLNRLKKFISLYDIDDLTDDQLTVLEIVYDIK